MTNIISSKSACQDGLNAVNFIFQWLQKLSLPFEALHTAQNLSKGFGSAADSLFVVDFINDINRLRLSTVDTFFEKKFEHLKASTYHLLASLSSGGESLKFVFGILGKIVLPRLIVGISMASICKMVVDLTETVTSYTQEKAQLIYLKIAQTITYIAVESFVIIGALFTTGLVGTPILFCLSLGLVFNYSIYRLEEPIARPVLVPA